MMANRSNKGARPTLLRHIGYALLFAAPVAAAPACEVASGPQRVALLELYTSEGCISCPASDVWLSRLPAKHLAHDRVIPLSFHVDYQDDTHWTDPYGQARFSQRQLLLNKRLRSNALYTTQIFLNGREYKRGVFDDIAGEVGKINLAAAEATLLLDIQPSPMSLDGTLDVTVDKAALPDQPQVFLALSEGDLTSVVTGGENEGKTLHHEHVVRQLMGPLALDDQGHLRTGYSFKLSPQWKKQNLRIAAYVQDVHNNVLQAVSGTCKQTQ